MKNVFIAGATGYLGQFLVTEYHRRGWHVRALVRDADRARQSGLLADELIEAEATQPETLHGQMAGTDLVISSLGITRQKDGLTYQDVDYRANLNLLEEALAAEVPRFAYIHVLNAEKMLDVPLVAAKQAFVDELRQASIKSTVIAPSGYFSDMADFISMARSGRAYLFGDGEFRLNPIHGEDLAAATADVIKDGCDWLDIGGPDLFSHTELAELAFAALNKPAKLTRLPDVLRLIALKVLPWVTPRHISGPAQFFLTAFGMDMVGAQYGSHHLADHFSDLARQDQ